MSPAALALLCWAAPAAAQTPAPPPVTVNEEVVVTATASPVGLEALARAVHVVLRADLAHLGVASLADALRLVPGVDVRARGPKDVQTDFSIRGATFGQTLVLADGFRLNDSQSGHHNGEIPLPAVALDRIEVLTGAGSSVHGADALGGVIHVLSRRDAHAAVSLRAGDHGFLAAEASSSGTLLPVGWLLTGWGNRSHGFLFDREFAQGGVVLRRGPAEGWTLDLRHHQRAFGANGFYGNSPSKEWTDQTMGGGGWAGTAGVWTIAARALYRNHGDQFRWDVRRPGFAENHTRTHAAEGDATARRELGGGRRLTVGAAGGADRIRSSNLGLRGYARIAGFVETQLPLGARGALQGGLRVDGYSRFGAAWSPSVAAVVRATPALRLRASATHAFRVPTFTELYYTDPGHLAQDDLRAERGWSLDAGADWQPGAWRASASIFARRDEDVIDWVKAQPADRWRTTNVRDVTARGIELDLLRRWRDGFVRAHYTGQRVDAGSLALLSKYVLEYARHAAGVAVSAPVGNGWRLAVSADHRRPAARSAYTLLNLRVATRLPGAELHVDVTNLFDEAYEEIRGVRMPGRWAVAGITIR